MTGLNGVVNILGKVYATGMKVAKGFKETQRISVDDFLRIWSYRTLPA